VLRLLISPEARGDLDGLRAVAPAARLRLLAFLEQLQADLTLLNALTIHDYGSDQDNAQFNVSKIQSLWNAQGRTPGKDLWRLKLWDLEKQGLRYRVIYAYEIRRQRHHILGVINRKDFNYEPDHPFTKRILHQYDDLCG